MSVGGGTWSWQMQCPTSCSFRGIVEHDCGGGDGVIIITLATWIRMLKLPIPDCKVYQIMVAQCCVQTSANKKVLKYFGPDLIADDLESQSHQPGDAPDHPTTSATGKVTPKAKVAWTPHKSRLQRSRTRPHRLKRKLVDTPKTAATDKNTKSADKQKLERLAKDLADYLPAPAVNFVLCQLSVSRSKNKGQR